MEAMEVGVDADSDAELLTETMLDRRDRHAFPRRVEVEGGGHRIWKRFVLLPNIQGQKYTIGRKFTSRTEQGEFIFLDNKQLQRLVLKGDPLCEINVEEEEGEYWVTPKGTPHENEVYINGVKIGEGKKARIQFGDRLSFQEQFPGGNENIRFLFKERELRPEAFIQDFEGNGDVEMANEETAQKSVHSESEAAFQVGRNDDIIPQILAYLPLKDLKNARLVSPTWEHEAIKIMKKRSYAKFKFDSLEFFDNPISAKFYADSNELMKMFRYSHEMRLNPLWNWSISLCNFETESKRGVDPSPGMPGTKLVSDFEWFLSSKPHYVRKLRLSSHKYSQLSVELVTNILFHLQETLEDLDLDCHWKEGASEFLPFIPLNFTKLKTLTLKVVLPVHDVNEIPSTADLLIHKILQASRTLRTLHLQECEKSCLGFLNKLDLFPNLEEIYVSGCEIEKYAGSVEALLKWNKPLEGMGLRLAGEWKLADVVLMEQLLEKHSPSLTTLKFCLPLNPCELNMPVFPKLKRLEVSAYEFIDDDTDEKIMGRILFNGGKEVDYGQHFPVLESLTFSDEELHDGCWRWAEEAFDCFLSPDKVCETVQRLEIPFLIDEGERLETLDPSKALEWAKTFPNAWNKWTTWVREREGGKAKVESN